MFAYFLKTHRNTDAANVGQHLHVSITKKTVTVVTELNLAVTYLLTYLPKKTKEQRLKINEHLIDGDYT